MRYFHTLPLLLVGGVNAFAPSARSFVGRPSTTARSFGIDPSHFTDVFQQFASSSVMLSDAMDALSDAATAAASTAADVATSAASTAVDVVASTSDTAVDAATGASDNGWFGFLTVPIEGLLQIIHSLIAATGTANSWGVSIIVLTVLIKVLTFPLTKTQLESTNKMQAMQPAIKEIQAKYQSNPEVMNQKIAEFYQTNEINPLAGCLPSLVQIPVFIGLYRAVLELAKDNKLDEAFLFLPNLEGPTYGADPATASDWILHGW
jgi:YidC/Oxa1 family membrane protein insertase